MSLDPSRPLGDVWAPRATRVELVVDGVRAPMTAVGDGWHSPAGPLPPGTRYAYSLDGGPLRADPRSHWQPDGLGGPSAVVDHDAFGWTDDRWRGAPLAGSVIHEIHVGTFTPEGTFDAAAARLPALADIGITTVELMPVAQLPGRWGWGYDGVLLYAPDHGAGGPDGLKRFVNAAHAAGLAVLLDVVYNHYGPEHAYLEEFGPYTHEAGATPWGRAVNLDGEQSEAVRAHVLGNAAHWITRYHVDGLRLDATHALVDATAFPILEELSTLVASLAVSLHRSVVLVAEDDRNDPRLSRPRDAGGAGLDGQWSDDQHHALHTVLTGEQRGYYARYGRPDHLVSALTRVFVDDGGRAHGGRARRGRPVSAETPRHRFVVCAQNHDQVGNRAGGERLVHLVGPAAACAAAAVTLLGPGTPLLFQGEEWGASSPFPFFTDFEDAALRDAVRDGRRREFAAFGWDPEEVLDPVDPATFQRAVLAWDERDRSPHAEILAWHRTLLALRRRVPDLADPDARSTDARLEGGGRVLVVRRGRVHVAVGLTGDGGAVDLTGPVLACSPFGPAIEQAAGVVTLPAYGVVVVGPP